MTGSRKMWEPWVGVGDGHFQEFSAEDSISRRNVRVNKEIHVLT